MNINSIDTGLLRFCLEHSDGPRTDVPSNVPARDPKDYQWLREALNNLEDDVQRMKRLLEVIKKEDSTSEDKAASLEELHFLVEDIDNACDLHKIDGFVPILRLLQSESSVIRMWAVWIISTVVQNNPDAQQRALEKGTLPRVINLFKTETDDQVVAKALGAVSGLVRDNPSARALFLKHANGLELLASIISRGNVGTNTVTVAEGPSLAASGTGMEVSTFVVSEGSTAPETTAQSDAPSTSTSASTSTTSPHTAATGSLSDATRMKAAFLLRNLIVAQPDLKDRIREIGLLPQLIDVLAHSTNCDLREKVLLVLQELLSGNASNVEAAKSLRLKEVLTEHIREGEQSSEIDICKELLSVLN